MSDLPELIVTQPDELKACCEYLAGCDRLGFDTEFVGEDTYHPHLCLVQVATQQRLYLIDPLTAGPLDQFWNLITDASRQIVVHAGREEVRLCHFWTGSKPANLFDLQIAAGLVGLPYPLSHGNLVSQVLGVQVPKGETLTEWRNRPLTRGQIQYALDDVRHLLAVADRLSEQLSALQRSDWAQEEFSRLSASVSPDDSAAVAGNERWRKLRGLGSLDRRRLAVVRELYHWREETAARTNRPARSICRDDLLVEIARRNPTREQDLHVVRGLPRRDLAAIVEAVASARGLPIEQCPCAADREQDPPQLTWVSNMLVGVLGDFCVRNRLAPNLVASNSDIKVLVRAQRQSGQAPTTAPSEVPLMQGCAEDSASYITRRARRAEAARCESCCGRTFHIRLNRTSLRVHV